VLHTNIFILTIGIFNLYMVTGWPYFWSLFPCLFHLLKKIIMIMFQRTEAYQGQCSISLVMLSHHSPVAGIQFMYEVWQLSSRNAPVKAVFNYLHTNGCCHLWSILLDVNALLRQPITHFSAGTKTHACVTLPLLWYYCLICFINTQDATTDMS
jgi:hypothetical protein